MYKAEFQIEDILPIGFEGDGQRPIHTVLCGYLKKGSHQCQKIYTKVLRSCFKTYLPQVHKKHKFFRLSSQHRFCCFLESLLHSIMEF